jgi:hypothetical protein
MDSQNIKSFKQPYSKRNFTLRRDAITLPTTIEGASKVYIKKQKQNVNFNDLITMRQLTNPNL